MSEPYNSEVMKWHSCLEKTQEKIWKSFNFIKSLTYSYCYLSTFLWMFICILRCIYLVVASSFQYFLGCAKPKRAFVWVMFCMVLCSVMMLTKLVYLGLNLDLRTPVCVFILRRQVMCNRLCWLITLPARGSYVWKQGVSFQVRQRGSRHVLPLATSVAFY